MAFQLYNTLTRRKEVLETAEPNHLRMYVCGPTVNDLAHLGHARCYTIYDVLVRYLRSTGLQVTYVRNITDVNDSIVEKAKKCNEDALAYARRIGSLWAEDITAKLRNLPADVEPRVTDHMAEIVSLIEKLIEKGAAYESQGDVYFRVKAFPGYGKLSHRNLTDLETGASGRTSSEEEARKEHPADFALWKKSPAGEQSWPSPWSEGRPGWHIECSAMTMKHLGETFDLHCGGLDLMFPHHENEIAQSEAATGKPFVKHWMHHGFIEVNKEKMSKSLGNFFTFREVLEHVEAEGVRLFALSVHYRSPLNLDWTLDEKGLVTGFPQIEEAERRVEYIYATLQRLAQIPETRVVDNGDKIPDGLAKFDARLEAGMNDDLNTPVALAAVAEFLKEVNELAENATKRKKNVARASYELAKAGMAKIGNVFGVGLDDPGAILTRIRDRRAAKRGIKPSDVDAKIAERNAARAAKDFARADAVRGELAALGVELMDGTEGTSWRIP